MESSIPDSQIRPLGDFVAQKLGLHFPPSRQPDLQRGIVAAADGAGFENAAEFVRTLLSTSPTQHQLDALARHLTVGETYFFRERRCFDVLTDQLIPSLAQPRPGSNRRLRIWSAGCCTGEEPYSIAISLVQKLPDWQKWDITLLATDLNPDFLRKAEAGIYGPWSFRDAPVGVQQKFFRVTPDGRFEVLPEIRRMVQFAQLNLADDGYPSPANNTHSMDVIFCRNVLMYFTLPQAKKVVQNLCRAQPEDGGLFTSATETPDLLCPGYQSVNKGDVIYYQKRLTRIAPPRPSIPTLPTPEYVPRQAFLAKKRPVVSPAARADGPRQFASLARSLADQGKLREALECCDRWIVADKLNPAGYYLRSVILQEQNAMDCAMQSLVKAIYLDPGFVVAHFAMGNIERNGGRTGEASRHLNNALSSLRRFNPADILPESDGITAGRLAEIIGSLQELEVAA